LGLVVGLRSPRNHQSIWRGPTSTQGGRASKVGGGEEEEEEEEKEEEDAILGEEHKL
jgi:hypothetical protein